MSKSPRTRIVKYNQGGLTCKLIPMRDDLGEASGLITGDTMGVSCRVGG
jgi:hypothetical protein